MPEVRFKVRWPDGKVDTCYSPSSIITSYFQAGGTYSLKEFLDLSREGLNAASDRVRARYGGSGCSLAMAQLAAIEDKVKRLPSDNMPVRVEGFVT